MAERLDKEAAAPNGAAIKGGELLIASRSSRSAPIGIEPIAGGVRILAH
jgi:hypothetical protein